MPKGKADELFELGQGSKDGYLSNAWRQIKKKVIAETQALLKEHGKDDDDVKAAEGLLRSFKKDFGPTLDKLEKAKTRDDQIKQAKKAQPICKAYTAAVKECRAIMTAGGGRALFGMETTLEKIEAKLKLVAKG